LLQVWSIGDGATLLKWEDGTDAVKEVTGQPFSCLTPFIVPHRHVGMSVAEIIADIAKVKTVLIRQTLDNVYKNNHARPQYDENMAGPNLASDLARPAPGSPIRNGGALITWDRPSSVIDVTLPMLAQFDDLKEQRSGATRASQGLNSESLNQHSENTVGMIMDAAMKKRLLIARTFAETGISNLFRLIHRDLRSGPMKRIATRIQNRWVDVDPRTWKYRTDMTVSVGMGSGDRDKKRQGLMLMGQVQRELMASGAPIVNLQNIYATVEKVMETYGFDSIEPYMTDPSQLPPPDPSQQKPDPQEQLMQAQLQKMQSEAQVEQMKAQTAQAELQMKQQAQDAGLAAEERKAQQDYDIKMAQIAERRTATHAGILTNDQRLELDRQKAVLEDDFKRDKLEADTLTAYNREVGARIDSQPPISYGSVTNG